MWIHLIYIFPLAEFKRFEETRFLIRREGIQMFCLLIPWPGCSLQAPGDIEMPRPTSDMGSHGLQRKNTGAAG